MMLLIITRLMTTWILMTVIKMLLLLLMMMMIIMIMKMMMIIHLFILPISSLPSRSFEAALCLPSFATFNVINISMVPIMTVFGG